MQAFVGTGLGKRAVICTLLLIAIGYFFWTESRYPQINDKALMGGAIQLQDPLSFEARYEIDAAWPIAKKIGYTTVNWIYTNRRGMIFGVLFGAAFLTLLRYLPRKSFRNGFANAATGFVIGAPLGVCVNCATPVGVGLHNGGARAETTLAAMIASPTFNIIVLTMVFSLFPFYMAATKIVLTLVTILVGVPLICRLMPAHELQVSDASACLINPVTSLNPREHIPAAVAGFVSDYGRDLWFIVRLTVPLMFAAGLLGSTMANLVPFANLAELPVNIATVMIAAVVGVIAPVPMAFDVILAAILLSGGVPIAIVMTLLFTLGTFSIYSFIVIGRTLSFRTSALLTAVIVGLGVAGGFGADAYHSWQLQRTLKTLRGLLEHQLDFAAQAATTTLEPSSTRVGSVRISSVPFNRPSPPLDGDTTLFSRIEAWHLGIDRPNSFSMAEMFLPYEETTGSVAAADIDNDGDQDVVMSLVDSGIMMFLNDGTGHFTRRSLGLPELDDQTVFNAAPVDLNNDGWVDLFITIDHGGNSIYWSESGAFSEDRKTTVANAPGAALSYVVAFGDFDQDGFLDAVIGNRLAEFREGFFPDERARNRIVFNDSGVMTGERFVETPGVPGETLSVLASDFDQDGDLDLIEANDFDRPDIFSLGDGRGAIAQITRADGRIPHSTFNTMSAKTADLDNDGRLEIYLTQITGRSDGLSERLVTQPFRDYCKGIERAADRQSCQRNVDIRSWYRIGEFARDPGKASRCEALAGQSAGECRESIMRDIAFELGDQSLCDAIPNPDSHLRRQCDLVVNARRGPPKDIHYPGEIPQIKARNVLFVRAGDGGFEDRTDKAGIGLGGWSWDCKIFDFDNNGLQDIFIANGVWEFSRVTPSKVYFENQGGLTFTETTDAVGLTDFLIVPSAAAADYDGDGDIDMIASSINGPMIAYINNTQSGHAIAFALRDHIGNRFGIGSKVTIRYGGDRQQLREMQLSGGFAAFDAPILHFGLGVVREVASVKIEWSTGEISEIDGPFEAGATFTVTRDADTVN